MGDRNRWASREEAEEYISNAIDNNNLGLTFCSACDYVGVTPANYMKMTNDFILSIHADCAICRRTSDIKDMIALIEYEMLCEEYLEDYSFNSDIISNEEYLSVLKNELKSRRLDLKMKRNNNDIPVKDINGEYVCNKRYYLG